MNGIRISVVIPVYNVEDYVEECLESVFSQMDSDIEVIIVNDGSADNSYTICQNVISRWKSHSIHLLNQENQGLSAARNNGMAVACGEYIMFLDSDDMLADGTFVKLKQYIHKFGNVDLFFYDAVIQNEMGALAPKTRYTRLGAVDSIIIGGKEYFAKYYIFPMIVSACMCLYKVDFLKHNSFRFEPGRLYEDVFFSFRSILTAENVLYIPEVLYVRRYHSNSITTMQKTQKHLQDYVHAYEQCILFIEQNSDVRRICNSLYYFIYSALLCLDYSQVRETGDKAIIEQFYNNIIHFYCGLSKIQKSFTFYKGLSGILKYGESHKIALNSGNSASLQDVLNLKSISTVQPYLDEKINQLYRVILSDIPFQDENVTVGIYGSGKHSRQLIDEYQRRNGEIKADILFIDSQEKSFTQKYLDRDIINIIDAEKYVDIIIISSFIYHLELKNLCKKYVLKKSIDIIDFYEEERITLF